MKRCINNDTVGTSDGGNDPLQRKLKNPLLGKQNNSLCFAKYFRTAPKDKS